MSDERDDGRSFVPRLARTASVARLGLKALRRTTPALYEFLAAKRPQLKIAWGRSEIHLRRDGLVRITRERPAPVIELVPDRPEREGPSGPFIPRRAGEQHGDEHMFRVPTEGLEGVDTSAPLQMDEGSMEADVKRRMGMRPDDEQVLAALAEDERSAEALNAELARIRDVLQALDDVEDHDLIKELDDELYQLYKAVDYKMRRHHASEAKAELGKLFKM